MAVYDHPFVRGLRIAYVFWPIPVKTPAWFDDNENAMWAKHPRLARRLFAIWAFMRSQGLIRMRYAGRTTN